MMKRIDYRTKITTHRDYNAITKLDDSIESDRGRIITSPAFRRLQKRTQVFALELNASIRTRITHSLEVAQTARFIARTIIHKLSVEKALQECGLLGMEEAFISTAEMASMLHDIGNPPFGHFGEAVMSEWVKEHFLPIIGPIESSNRTLKSQLMQDIASFEGNAQAIRIITTLQRLNLSYTQIAATLKYPRGGHEPAAPKRYLTKKPGFFYSEKEFVMRARQTLEIEPYCRHPITYIMEAADDISYLLADMEDAVDKGVVSFEQMMSELLRRCEEQGDSYLSGLLREQIKRQQEKAKESHRIDLFFNLMRSQMVRDLVAFVAQNYFDHHDAVFEGTLDSALLDLRKDHPLYKATKIIAEYSVEYIYRSKEVKELEMQGYSILRGLLGYYKPLLQLNFEDFPKLLQKRSSADLLAPRLLERIGKKQLAAYHLALKECEGSRDFALLERYYRMRMVLDYIGGMTDDYALHEYRLLHAL